MSLSAKRRWRLILTLVTFAALAGLVFVLRRQILDTFRNLDDVNALVLPLMIVWQALNYHSYTRLYQDLFVILGERIRYRSMLRVVSELNFVNSVFPSGGVSGFSYFSVRMKDADVTTGKATLVQLMRFVSIFASFQLLLFAGLFFLAVAGSANDLTILVAASLATLLLVGTMGLAFIIGSKTRINSFFTFITKGLNRFIHLFRPQYPETINIARARPAFNDLHENYIRLKSNPRALVNPLRWALLCNIAELMTIYTVYVAFGEWVNPGAVILAYAVANFAGIISVLPGGIGAYEALMTAVLAAAGVSPALSIPVTVMYRVLNMLLQLPLGYYLYHRRLHSNTTRP